MINYLELPSYLEDKKEPDELINLILKPILEGGKKAGVRFDSKYEIDFNKIKKQILNNSQKRIEYFLLCINELKTRKTLKLKLLVTALVGNQGYEEVENIFEELKEGIDYGHLKKLQIIFDEYNDNNQDQYYLTMMKDLCKPYMEVMIDVILMCKGLFKEKSYFYDEKESEIILPEDEYS